MSIPDPKQHSMILLEKSLGPYEKRVAVLGAFDTWALMHKIAVSLAKKERTAVTSRYYYYPDDNLDYVREPNYPENPKQTMNDFLKYNVINDCSKAIIVYSVPAAHYNEAEWCEKFRKETLGIAFVRNLYDNNFCPDCVVDHKYEYAYCCSEDTGWECISKPDCPFKKQEIAKSQLEYYTTEYMTLIAVEKLEKVDNIIDLFINKSLYTPKRKPFVFEFRLFLEEDEYSIYRDKLFKIVTQYEDRFYQEYEYVDYYYKPTKLSIDKWFKLYRTLRIRDWRVPKKTTVEYMHSDVNIYDFGFITVNRYGNKILLDEEINRLNEYTKGLQLHEFMRVYKDSGYKFEIKDPFPFTIYIEKITAQISKKSDVYTSIEIEFWVEDPNDQKKIKEKCDIIINSLDLSGKNRSNLPLQFYIYNKLLNK